MKYAYCEMPESLKGTYADFSRQFGFSWKEFVATVPSPLFLVTTYKSNGLPNACMQSWATFTSADHGNHFRFSLSCIGEGNGNPLQCSCLENLRDGGAWWAAICGVAQSRTQLKRLTLATSCEELTHWKRL